MEEGARNEVEIEGMTLELACDWLIVADLSSWHLRRSVEGRYGHHYLEDEHSKSAGTRKTRVIISKGCVL